MLVTHWLETKVDPEAQAVHVNAVAAPAVPVNKPAVQLVVKLVFDPEAGEAPKILVEVTATQTTVLAVLANEAVFGQAVALIGKAHTTVKPEAPAVRVKVEQLT